MGILDALFGRATGRPAAIGDSDSFTVCSSFGCNTYTITLVDIVNNGDGTVTVTVDQDGDDGATNAVPTVTLTIVVQTQLGAVTIYEDTREWFPTNHITHTGSGAGAEGDTVTVTASTGDFGGAQASLNGVVPSALDPDLLTFVDGSGVMSPNPVQEDETVTFSIDVSNDNNVDATFELSFDDRETGDVWAFTSSAVVAANATETISLSAIPENVPKAPGDYTMDGILSGAATAAVEGGMRASMSNVRPAP